MSGGSLNYFCYTLEEHIGDFGDKELDDLVKDLANLFHAREWFLSEDTKEESWDEARDTFKKKWFSDIGRTARIEKYLDDIREEVLKSFGVYGKDNSALYPEPPKETMDENDYQAGVWYDMGTKPIEGKDYLLEAVCVKDNHKCFVVGKYEGEIMWLACNKDDDCYLCNHWMLIPEPPKKE